MTSRTIDGVWFLGDVDWVLIEGGRLGEAVDELGALGVAVERIGGPVKPWRRRGR